jgi:hypothetical protein
MYVNDSKKNEMSITYIIFFSVTSHDNLPPSIVNLAPFPTDDILYNACRLRDQDWGNYQLPGPTAIKPEDYLHYCDQAGDFTMAHRDTWKTVRGYREAGGVAW